MFNVFFGTNEFKFMWKWKLKKNFICESERSLLRLTSMADFFEENAIVFQFQYAN